MTENEVIRRRRIIAAGITACRGLSLPEREALMAKVAERLRTGQHESLGEAVTRISGCSGCGKPKTNQNAQG